jgi:ABC-type polysaccharide/polyol phosphate export permease
MGICWHIIHPLVMILLYSVIFFWIFHNQARGGNYALHLISGLLAWRTFSETIQRGSNAFIENARYLKHLAIPSEVFVAKVALTATFMLFFNYIIFIPVGYLSGTQFRWSILLLPLLLVLLQTLAFGISLILADIQAFFHDVHQVINVFIPLWLWTLPVIYPEDIVPEAFRSWLYMNPPYAFLRAIRHIIVHNKLPDFYDWSVITIWLFIILWTGSAIHRKLRYELREVI